MTFLNVIFLNSFGFLYEQFHFSIKATQILGLSHVLFNRVPKWWRHKNEICEIMGFVKLFWKNNVQDAYSPKISNSGQIVSEILAQLCCDDSIQILLNLAWFIRLGTELQRIKGRPFCFKFFFTARRTWNVYFSTLILSRTYDIKHPPPEICKSCFLV